MGINLLPTDRKVCSFNCIYCQYGKTLPDDGLSSEIQLPSGSEIIEAVERALKKPRTIDCLTFSGNGEPTMHPEFSEIVHQVKFIRDRLRSATQLAIFSNASRLMDPEVLEAMAFFDAPMMKLDAGDENTFQTINRPEDGLSLNDLVEEMKVIPNLIVQSMLIDGPVSNIWGEPYQNWARLLNELHPQEIHIYSAERPSAEEDVGRVAPERLQQIALHLRERFGLNVLAFWRD